MQNIITQLIVFSGLAGSTVFLGGLLSYFFEKKIPTGRLKHEIIHLLTAFGAGIILSAVALVLIPKGMHELTLLPVVTSFAAGAVIFGGLDYYCSKLGGSVATLMAMLMDFIPEAIALGAVFAIDTKTAMLLALFIALQNFPESFISYRDLIGSGFSARTTLIMLFILSFFGIGAALLGHFVLSAHRELTAGLMLFASGGILYLLFQDIIPESKIDGDYLIPLGATLGFTLGMIGEKMI